MSRKGVEKFIGHMVTRRLIRHYVLMGNVTGALRLYDLDETDRQNINRAVHTQHDLLITYALSEQRMHESEVLGNIASSLQGYMESRYPRKE